MGLRGERAVNQACRMSLCLDDLYRIRSGRNNPFQVGELPDYVVRALGWRCPFVYLSLDSLLHIAKKHPDVTDQDLPHIPLAIRFGLIVADAKDRGIVMLSYVPQDGDKQFRCVLKATSSSTEIWVSTLHRTKPRQVQALIRRGEVLRRHAVL